MAGLIGRFLHSVDHKGRLSLPAKLRKPFQRQRGGRRFKITLGLDGCLFVFPSSEWNQIEAKIRELPKFAEKARFFVRSLASNASDAQLDAQGRIAIPQSLLEQANIEGEVLVIGALDRIELWDPKTFETYNRKSGLTYEQVAQDLLL